MRTIKLGEPLIHLQSVDSTNRYAISLIRSDNASEGTVILADHQEKGKGQGGNSWHSEKNSNLLFSIILKPDFIPAEKQFYLSMSVSTAIATYLSTFAGRAVIKWPNDILINAKKIAGILIENTILGDVLHSSVVGIGLNVNQKNFPPDIPNPVSLALITGQPYDISEVLSGLLASLSESFEELYGSRLDRIRTKYLNHLWKLNEWAEYIDSTGQFEGRIAEVADSGELIILRRNGKIMTYGFKEIQYV